MSESILRASSRVFEHELEPKLGTNSNLNWNAYLERKLDLGLKLEIELGLELSNSNSNSDSSAATRTRTRELELEPELYFGLQRALELGLELQAYLSFRCTSSQVSYPIAIQPARSKLRKLALRRCELELLRSHTL